MNEMGRLQRLILEKWEVAKKFGGLHPLVLGLIDYIYAEILYSIDNQKFYMPKRSREAQAKLFTIGINGKDIFLYTHWAYNAKHVKCFKCVSEDEAKNIVQAIRSAVEQVGLNFVPIKFGNEKAGIKPGTKFDELPDNFECPLCHVGKEMFAKEE